MIKQLKFKRPQMKSVISMTAIIVFMVGCVSQRAANVKFSNPKRIIDIVVNENSESLEITIKGNQPLTYTVKKQPSPKGLLINFPGAAFDIGKGNYSPPYNDIIWSIKTSEIFEKKAITSRVFIALKKDTPYDLTPNREEILVTFSKSTVVSDDVKPQPKPAAIKPQPKFTPTNIATATRIKAITAKPSQNKLVVHVQADGTVKDFKSFTLYNSGKIVFDLFKLKSPFKQEQKIAVSSKWIKQIRYFGHPDRVRLVLETHKDYLAKYAALPTESGLLIHVGDTTGLSAKAVPNEKKENPRTKRVTLTWDKVPNATSYNVYLSNSPGVGRHKGSKISNIKSNYTTAELKPGATYYFVVTAVNESGESTESEEITFTVGD